MKWKMPDLSAFWKSCKKLFQRFKIPILFLALGLLLLSLPKSARKSEAPSSQTPAVNAQEETSEQMHERLAQVLSAIDGVGRVELMLSMAKSEETVYQTDIRRTGGDTGYTEELTTVFSSASGSQKEPLITITKNPVYRGAVVVCDGADSAAVRLAIVNAVSSLTGLGSDKITVVKMKGQ